MSPVATVSLACTKMQLEKSISENDRLREENNKLENNVRTFRGECQNLRKDVKTTRANNIQLQKETERLLSDNQRLQQELKQMKASNTVKQFPISIPQAIIQELAAVRAKVQDHDAVIAKLTAKVGSQKPKLYLKATSNQRTKRQHVDNVSVKQEM
ncbi:hypothetical protein FI667_g43, partial [Globisporangium splendens]